MGREMDDNQYSEFAKRFDHTFLPATYAHAKLKAFVNQGITCRVGSLTSYPTLLHLINSYIASTKHIPARAATISFPHGTDSTSEKIHTAKQSVILEATVLDPVINLTHVINDQPELFYDEMIGIADQLPQEGKMKVILKLPFLQQYHNDDGNLKKRIFEWMNELYHRLQKQRPDIQLVAKNGTGRYGEATVEDITLMREHLIPEIPIKAAGGIRTSKQVQQLADAGAHYFGTSQTHTILHEH